MSTIDEQPPPIPQVHREFLKSGSEIAFRQVEDAARSCAELECAPRPRIKPDLS